MIHDSIILGIDPGYGRIGIAVLQKLNGKQKLLHSECFETSSKLPHSKRLLALGERVSEIMDVFKPTQMAVETLLFNNNQKTAIQVAEARGIVLYQAARRNILVREFNPNQIKLAVTGYGKSDKKQIISMVQKLLKMGDKKKYDDEYDAIAAAITCDATSYMSVLSTELV